MTAMVSRRNFTFWVAMLVALGIPLLARADHTPVDTQIVDALTQAWGAHPGYRVNHAKGIVVEGRFKASPQAATLSKAALFDGSTIPATIRFSNATGLPNVEDGQEKANPRGMAIKFHLPNGRDFDIVVNSLKYFPVATPEEFRDLVLAANASPPNALKPTKFEEFVAVHPVVGMAIATAATPDSFADEQYRGIDAFVFVDKSGARQAVRYLVDPEQLVHLSKDDAARQAPDYLMDELRARLALGSVTFHLKAQLAAATDSTRDPTRPWPDSRPVVDLGMLTLDKAVADSANAEKKLLFLPGHVIEGIEPSDDPMIAARDGVYEVSFERRTAKPISVDDKQAEIRTAQDSDPRH